MIVVGAHTFQSHNGYGRWSRSIVESLQRLGYNTWIAPATMVPIPDDLKHLVKNAKPDIIVFPPFVKSDSPVHFTTYESTILPSNMVKELRKRKVIAVLSEYNKTMCRDSGIKNVYVCHPQVKASYIQEAPFSPFTFTHIGADNSVPERKRTSDVIKAFLAAFPVEDNVRLIIKKSPEDQKIPCFDARITSIHDNLESLNAIYDKTHVGVFPCGQEGWGYCQSDLMARGRPVIVPYYGGPKDFANAANSYILPYHMVKTPRKIYQNQGLCARVKISDISKAMRFAYENKDDTILKGVQAYRTMLGFSESHMDAKIEQVLQAA